MRQGILNPELDSQQNNHTGKSKTERDYKKLVSTSSCLCLAVIPPFVNVLMLKS